MKKNLLIGIALLASVAVNAQKVVYSLTGTADDQTSGLKATVTGSTTIKATDATCGEGFAVNGVQTNWKDAAGTAYKPFDTEVAAGTGGGLLKFVPQVPNDDDHAAWATADEAVAGNGYVEFAIEESDVNKDLKGLKSIKFDASKLGTDASRINAKIFAEGDGNVESAWLFNAETCATFGDAYDGWDEAANGYNPSREDASKSSGVNTDGRSHIAFNIPADITNANPYILKLRIYGYKVKNNKAFAFYNVTFDFEEGASGINNIKAAVSNNGAIYNIAGQRVANDYKGLVIKNGKKMIQK